MRENVRKVRSAFLFRASIYVIGLALLLYAAAVAVMSTHRFQRYLAAKITDRMASVTGARVAVGRLVFHPFALQIDFHKLVLRGRESPSEAPLFAAGTLVLALNPLSVFEHRILLRRLDCEDAAVHLYTYKGGTTNLPGPLRSGASRPAIEAFLDLAIGRVTIARTDFFWDDRKTPLNLAARNVAILLAYSLDRRYVGTFTTSAFTVSQLHRSLPPSALSVRLNFSSRDLAVPSFSWRGTGLAANGSAHLSWYPAVSADFTAEVTGDVAPALRHLGLNEIHAGSIRCTTKATYRAGRFAATGAFQARQVRVRLPDFNPGPLELAADYNVAPRQVSLSNVILGARGGHAKGALGVVLGQGAPRFSLQLRLDRIDLSLLLDATSEGRLLRGRLPVAGQAQGAIAAEWSGMLHNLRSRFDVGFFPPATTSRGLLPVSGSATGAATWNGGLAVTLDNALVRTPHSEIAAMGFLGRVGSTLNLQLKTSDFQELRPEAESLAEASLPLVLKAPATFSGVILNIFQQPEIRGHASLGAFDYGGWAWDSLSAQVDATRTSFQVSSGRLLAGPSTLDFDASATLHGWKFEPNSSVHLAAHAQGTPLAGLRRAFRVTTPINGSITGRVNLDGPRRDLTGSGAVRVEHGDIAGEPFDWLTASFSVSRSVFDTRNFELAQGPGRLSGEAMVGLTSRTLHAQVHGSGFALADLHWPSASVTPLAAPPRGLSGELSFEVRGSGTLDRPAVQASVKVQDVLTANQAIGTLTGKLDWHDGRIQAQAALAGPAGSAHASGTAQTTGLWPFEASGDFTALHPASWLGSLQVVGLAGSIKTSGSFTASGSLKNARQVTAHARIVKLDVGFPGLVWSNDRPIQLTLAARRLTVSRFHVTGPSTDFRIEGSVALTARPSLSVDAQGHIDARLVNALDPSVLAAGGLDVSVRASGSTQRPSVFGTVKVVNVSLGYPGMPVRLTGLNGEITLDGDRLTIRSLQGSSGRGAVQVTGAVVLSGGVRYDLRARIDQARIQYPLDFTSLVSGNLHLVGTASGGAARGNLTVEQMFVHENFNLVDWLNQLSNQVPAPSVSSHFASKVRLNIRIASAPVVTIDSRDLTLVAGIGFTLRGSLGAPVVLGDVHLQSGRATIRGTTYTLTRGEIAFTNPLRTQPVLDLEARTRVQRYNLALTISGPAERPAIAYRSDPPLPTAGILSLLALGYSTQQQAIAAGATGTRSAFGTLGATALLNQALSSQVSSRIQRLFGISRIGIDPNPIGLGGARVTVQEQLARDFTITYVTTTGAYQERIIQVEWDLSQNVSLLGVRDQNGVLGVELDFRHRFK